MASTSTYIYQNRHQNFYFQIRNPTFKVTSTKLKSRFRKSLHTKNRRIAEKRARIMLYVLDKLIEYYWNSSDDYAYAQKLLLEYNAIDGWAEADEFLAELGEGDTRCLEKVIKFEKTAKSVSDLNQTKESLHDQVAVLTDKKIGSEKRLSEILEQFIGASKKRWKPQCRESNEHKDYRPKIRLFIEIVGDVAGYDLSKAMIGDYRDALFKMPKNRKKLEKYAGKSVSEIMKMKLNDSDCLSNVTLQNHFTKIGVFLTWCAENGYTNVNLHSPLRKAVRITKQSHEHRDTFTNDDLKALFESDVYVNGKHNKASQYWVPLLGLFTGARENELCQLHVGDIQQEVESGVWYIDFCEDKSGDKSIKGSKKRKVPIHKQLIKLGFLKYVEDVAKSKSKHLFPDVTTTLKGDPIKVGYGYAQAFSKWFNRTYRKNCNVGQGDEKRDFHSFRHTLTDYYKQRDIAEHLVCEITGHAPPVGMAYGTYGKPSDLKKRRKLMNKLVYDIDFSLIKKWQNNKFHLKLRRRYM